MTTTISLPVAEYNRAKTFAEEQNLSIDELFVALIGQLTLREEDAVWNQHDFKQPPYTIEELSARIDESEKQFERGEYKSHEQMMADLKKEFPWLM